MHVVSTSVNFKIIPNFAVKISNSRWWSHSLIVNHSKRKSKTKVPSKNLPTFIQTTTIVYRQKEYFFRNSLAVWQSCSRDRLVQDRDRKIFPRPRSRPVSISILASRPRPARFETKKMTSSIVFSIF